MMIGREIAGRFRVVAKLGEGGMGAVFRAEQISLKRTVALKLLRPSLASSSQLIRRFNAEAQAVAQLNHPNTVGIYDFGEHEGMLFIAMELIEGVSLRDVVAREAPLPPVRALMIAQQLAASLADAHAHGIVHRDLKPDNVMLQQRGKTIDVVRVLDFGIAKLRDDAQGGMTRAGDVMGTPQYIAPEQAKGEAIDGRTDIYALGCMLYEMLTGRLPFEGTSVMALLAAHMTKPVEPPAQRRPDLAIPPALDALVVAMMAKDPAARPPTMEVLGDHLAQILATLPSAPWQTTAHGSIASPVAVATRSRAPLMAILGVLALGCIGAGIYVATRSSKSTPASDPVVEHGPPDPIARVEPDAVARPADPGPGSAVVPDPGPGSAALDPDPVPDPPVAFDPATQSPNLPEGARLIAPAGYTQTRDATTDKLVDTARNILIALQPVNDHGDMATLAPAVAAQYSFTLDHVGTVTSAGKPRDAAWFTGQTNGVAMKMMMILYDGPTYRIACVGIEPVAIWNEQAALQFFADNVAMP